MDDNWDLYAVVRSCSATGTSSSTTTTAAAATCHNVFTTFQQQDYDFSSALLQDLVATRKESLTNDELNKNNLSSQSLPISPLSVLEGFQDLSYEPQQQQPHCTQKKQQLFCVVNNGSKSLQNSTSRSKRRKNHMKKVCHVPAENLSSDKWSWRKYGQKPIKGSPYPRGYYKCSTLKGCMARKQVERNRSDPGMFIVTYTAEHNHPVPTHRNSLAGITRQKLPERSTNPITSPEFSPEKLVRCRDEVLGPEEEDDNSSASNVALDEDFFAGLEDLTGPVEAGECCSGGFSVRFDGFPMVVDF